MYQCYSTRTFSKVFETVVRVFNSLRDAAVFESCCVTSDGPTSKETRIWNPYFWRAFGFYGVATGLCSLKQLLSHQFLALKAICPAETVTNTAVQIILILNVLKYTVLLNIRVYRLMNAINTPRRGFSHQCFCIMLKKEKGQDSWLRTWLQILKKPYITVLYYRIMLYAHYRAEIVNNNNLTAALKDWGSSTFTYVVEVK